MKFVPSFDAARAKRTVAELCVLSPDIVADSNFATLIESVAGNSPYLASLMQKDAAFLLDLLGPGIETSLTKINAEVIALSDEDDIVSIMRRLRMAKRRVALAIGLADCSGAYDVVEVTSALTRFADVCVRSALNVLLRAAAKKEGMHSGGHDGLEQSTGLIVIAMGKMGAFELNYSSDIDLIVFYDEERFPFTRDGEKRVAAVELVRGLVRLLSETTADGYVFRIDLRLRPDAGATQIAISSEAAEAYYESMGQNWERAAWIKARQCAGDSNAGARFFKNMEHFVWRKNLDYAAIQDIHSIKRQIQSHVGHGSVAVLGHNIKLGRGGIREIEFFTQTQQLILGGRDPSLRDPTTLGALRALCRRGHISAQAEQEMADAYLFLRMVEHRLQMIDDQQTHTIPKLLEGLDHVARFAGYADTAAFKTALRAKLSIVQRHYAQLFESEAPLASEMGSLVFTGVEEDPETVASLTRMGFERAAGVSAVIRGWHHGRIRATRSARARELLTKLIPPLLTALAKTADPQSAFAHFDHFISNLSSGVQLFSMLLASPKLLDLIAEIAGSAPRLADYLGRNVSVLDALVDPGFLNEAPQKNELQARIDEDLARAGNFEASLEAARRFAKEESFRVGVQVIQGFSSAEQAGPAYARIAEVVIEALQELVEREMMMVHGRIPGGAVAIVAQGKLGGREMTATSDLDLVFIYTHDADAVQSGGTKPLAPSTYFARVAQRFIAALSAMTAEGRLYEVDMRLRPSGNQGPVAVRLETFVDYHQQRSWTWERMALTRARVLSGAPALRQQVEDSIMQSLIKPCDAAAVRSDARAMREKLAVQFPGRDPWDIKFAPGGLIDLEFIAQTLQLCHAVAHPDVLNQNTITALRKLSFAGALDPADGEILIDAARLQHGLTQVLRIAVEGAFKSDVATRGLKSLLARAGGEPDFPALERRLIATQISVRTLFERVLS